MQPPVIPDIEVVQELLKPQGLRRRLSPLLQRGRGRPGEGGPPGLASLYQQQEQQGEQGDSPHHHVTVSVLCMYVCVTLLTVRLLLLCTIQCPH